MTAPLPYNHLGAAAADASRAATPMMAVVATGTDLCRVTVVGPDGRADLALPVTTTVAALLPTLARHVATDPADVGTPWVLQRLGEDPLDADGTPATLELRDGDVLHLRPAEEPLPVLHFDDVADGVAQVVAALPGRWSPALTRGLLLAVSGLVLAALAVAMLALGPGLPTASVSGAICVVLAAGCVAAARLGSDKGGVLVAGVGSIAFGGLTGLTIRQGPSGDFAPGFAGVLAAAMCVAVLAIGLLALRPLPPAVPGTVLVTALAAAAGAALMRVVQWHGSEAVSVVAVGTFVLNHFGPRLSLRMARLHVPRLPRNAEELQEDIEPEAQERVERGVALASAYLDTLSLSSALVYAVGFWYMTREGGWIGWLLPLVFSGAVLLHTRGLDRWVQRMPMVIAGSVGLITVLLTRFAPVGTGARLAVIALLLGAVAGLLVAAWRLPGRRLLPVWGHIGDLLEMATAIVLLPLLLQFLHAYTYFRTLTS
ncbi:type VII secretion integral membrane protein EccD [Actinacidiphila glaucinigra]|uniref:type VII secretion integral membrane protein EccD n=1 Tax=Actinacidiphila glaucinigra TaxID=235986 RepID=UPI0035D8D7CE